MPSTSPIELNSGKVLAGTPTLLYTTPTGILVTVRRAVFTNAAATPILLNVWKCAAGVSPTSDNIILNSWLVSINEAYVFPGLANMVLNPNETIYASCAPPNSINAFLSGFQTQ